MQLEEFFSQTPKPSSGAFPSGQYTHHLLVPAEVRWVASLGLRVFPVPTLAKLTNPNLLIGEASCEISRLEELAAEYGAFCSWRAAIDPSLCALRIDGHLGGWNSVAALSQDDQEACDTLQAHRGDTVWALFRRSKSLLPKASARKLAPGLSVLADGVSCPVPVPKGRASDIRAVPCWLREAAYEAPDSPAGKAAPAPVYSPRPGSCRSRARFEKPRGSRKGYPVCGQAGWRGFHISRRR